MHKQDRYVYLIINGVIFFLILCVWYQLTPLFQSVFGVVYKIISPFLFGFILASLIYPVVLNVKSKILKMLIILGIYLGLIFIFISCILVTIPQLMNDFNHLLNYFQMDIRNLHLPVVSSLQVSSKALMVIMNAIVISLFYLFDEDMVAKIYLKIPNRLKILSRYYDFIEYFYSLFYHLLCRMGLILVLMLAIKQPYALLIALISMVSVIPIIGNLFIYGILILCLIYHPMILMPVCLLMLYDFYFFACHRYHWLKMLVILIALRVINVYCVVFTLPVYFLVIQKQ